MYQPTSCAEVCGSSYLDTVGKRCRGAHAAGQGPASSGEAETIDQGGGVLVRARMCGRAGGRAAERAAAGGQLRAGKAAEGGSAHFSCGIRLTLTIC